MHTLIHIYTQTHTHTYKIRIRVLMYLEEDFDVFESEMLRNWKYQIESCKFLRHGFRILIILLPFSYTEMASIYVYKH